MGGMQFEIGHGNSGVPPGQGAKTATRPARPTGTLDLRDNVVPEGRLTLGGMNGISDCGYFYGKSGPIDG